MLLQIDHDPLRPRPATSCAEQRPRAQRPLDEMEFVVMQQQSRLQAVGRRRIVETPGCSAIQPHRGSAGIGQPCRPYPDGRALAMPRCGQRRTLCSRPDRSWTEAVRTGGTPGMARIMRGRLGALVRIVLRRRRPCNQWRTTR